MLRNGRSSLAAWGLGTIGLVGICVTVACVGGGGSASDVGPTWEPTGSSLERAGSNLEGAPSSQERGATSREGSGSTESAPGAQREGTGATSFDCAGTYSCQEVGDDDVDTLVLSAAAGGCTFTVEGVTVLVGADGKLTARGQTVGSWSPIGNGIRVSIGKDSVVCTKGGAAPVPTTQSPSPVPTTPSTGGGNTGSPTPRDAG